MFSKKNKALLAAVLAGTFAVEMIAGAGAASAKVGNDVAESVKGTIDKSVENAYGDTTYADRFMSLYDDVVTRGVANGYMSSKNNVSGGLGIPYHAAEEVVVEAPDYGHETTSEAMSYLVWVAAMHDHVVNAVKNGDMKSNSKTDYTNQSADLAKAWKTLEVMIPSFQGQSKYLSVGNVSATYSDEWPEVEDYPTAMMNGNTASDPLHQTLASAYSGENEYLLHWLADVDNWYGFGADSENIAKGTTSFTFINTFQRGEQESCWETIPFGCVEKLNNSFGMVYNGKNYGMKGFFDCSSSGQPNDVAAQWRYTNAPDAEDRAIQAVYDANLWGVQDSSVTALAGKLGDFTREDMYDKYYKAIGCQNKSSGQDYSGQGKHYLMAWYTSWGGAINNSWAWQIGASHAHEFYQNPLAAYALLEDSGLNAGMKSSGASQDFETSLVRQIEFYIWLQSKDGPIAGGATNSWGGQYKQYPSGITKFYNMAYVEHPVYADPGSNHWIGNQVWAVQRLSELYYRLCQPGAKDYKLTDNTSMKEALGRILDKWVMWFDDNTIIGSAKGTKTVGPYKYDRSENQTAEIPDISTGLTDDGKSYSIPASLIWSGQPSQDYSSSSQVNDSLTCQIVGYGSADIGCVASLANTLLYYAKAKGIDSSAASDRSSYANADGSKVKATTDNAGKQALYIAKQLLDREWDQGRDEIGLSIPDTNGSLSRFWDTSTTKVLLPNGSRKNGDGLTLPAYEGKMPNGDVIKDGVSFYDIRSNYKNIDAYNDLKDYYDKNGNTDKFELNYHRFWHEGDAMVALGVMATLYNDLTPGTTEEPPTTEPSTTTTAATTTTTVNTTSEGATTTTNDGETLPSDVAVKKWGDANLDGEVTISDAVLMQRFFAGNADMDVQGKVNTNLYQPAGTDTFDITDAEYELKFLVNKIEEGALPLTTPFVGK